MTTQLESNLLTAEEYGQLPDDGRITELAQGKIVELTWPYTAHGYLMTRIGTLLWQFVDQHDLGRATCGGAGVVTQRNPDSVRGPDVAFYSYERIPRGPLPYGYWPASPELVVEIRCQSDRWKDILQKAAEYLSANVLTVAVVDPEQQQVHLFSANREPLILRADDILTFPDVLPGFEIIVERLFE